MGGVVRSFKKALGLSKPKTPSADEIARQERARVESERAEQLKQQQEQQRIDLEEDQRRRAAFRSGAGDNEEDLLGRKTIVGG